MSFLAKYGSRACAAGYMLFWVAQVAMALYAPAGDKPMTLGDAFQVVAVIGAAIWLGWHAGCESKEPKP